MIFSLITCTYNPDLVVFNRLINAISQLEIPINVEIEWIIVDNNSKQSVEKSFDFSSIQIPLLHIVEQTPGLTSARIAGFKASKGDWLVFFDDDNEPSRDYLIVLLDILISNSSIGCIGPGVINVEYIGFNKQNPFQNQIKSLFQEKKLVGTIFKNQIGIDFNYPCGTGLICKRKIFEDYTIHVMNKTFTLTDRIGKSLVSGGDTQLLYLALKNGYYAGYSDLLRLNHLILKNKTSLVKILKLQYMLNSSSLKAYIEVFPNAKKEIQQPNIKDFTICLKSTTLFLLKTKKVKLSLIYFYQHLGNINARLFANKKLIKPLWIKLPERLINI